MFKLMHDLLQDWRYSLPWCGRSPGLAAVITMSLVLARIWAVASETVDQRTGEPRQKFLISYTAPSGFGNSAMRRSSSSMSSEIWFSGATDKP